MQIALECNYKLAHSKRIRPELFGFESSEKSLGSSSGANISHSHSIVHSQSRHHHRGSRRVERRDQETTQRGVGFQIIPLHTKSSRATLKTARSAFYQARELFSFSLVFSLAILQRVELSGIDADATLRSARLCANEARYRCIQQPPLLDRTRAIVLSLALQFSLDDATRRPLKTKLQYLSMPMPIGICIPKEIARVMM